MAQEKKDSNKREYNYRYRPFFWSLHIKTSHVTNEDDLGVNNTLFNGDDS